MLATLALIAQETEHPAEEASGLDIVLPAVAELVYGALAFALLFFVLAKFAFPRLNDALRQRQVAIQGKLEESEAKLTEAETVRRRYEEQLGDARGEANRIIEEARQTADAMRRELVTKAEQDAQAVVARAQAEVVAERDRAIQALRQEVGVLSVQLATKIVEKELDANQHQALIDGYIQQLAQNN